MRWMYRLMALVVLGGALLFPMSVAAADSNGNISHSYETDAAVRLGSIVSAKNGSATAVELTNTSNAERLIGVAVNPETTLLAVDADETKVQVATNGSVKVLVSDVNGAIRSGDRVAASPFSGIGMKSVAEGYIVGIAEADFDVRDASSEAVTDKDGARQQVNVGYVTIALVPGHDIGAESGNKLQQMAQSLTGRLVSTPRIIASIVIAFLTLVGVGVLMYAAIYGSLVSIGRNPLARASIFRALSTVVIIAVLATGLALGVIYMLLR